MGSWTSEAAWSHRAVPHARLGPTLSSCPSPALSHSLASFCTYSSSRPFMWFGLVKIISYNLNTFTEPTGGRWVVQGLDGCPFTGLLSTRPRSTTASAVPAEKVIPNRSSSLLRFVEDLHTLYFLTDWLLFTTLLFQQPAWSRRSARPESRNRRALEAYRIAFRAPKCPNSVWGWDFCCWFFHQCPFLASAKGRCEILVESKENVLWG